MDEKHRFLPPIDLDDESADQPSGSDSAAPEKQTDSSKLGDGYSDTGMDGLIALSGDYSFDWDKPDKDEPSVPSIKPGGEFDLDWSTGSPSDDSAPQGNATIPDSDPFGLESADYASLPAEDLSGDHGKDTDLWSPTAQPEKTKPSTGYAARVGVASDSWQAASGGTWQNPNTGAKAKIPSRDEKIQIPKKGVFIVAFGLMTVAIVSLVWRHLAAESRVDSVVESMEQFSQGRELLYERLRQLAVEGTPVQDDFCPSSGDVSGDVTFVFEGSSIPIFDIRPRGERETIRLAAFQRGDIDIDQLELALDDNNALSPTVVFVRVREWRLPRANSTPTDRHLVTDLTQGYAIADAYVGNTTSEGLVCSFRFFSASSQQAEIPEGVDLETGLQMDFLTQTHAAIMDGMTGREALPGVSGGRYDLLHPPMGL